MALLQNWNERKHDFENRVVNPKPTTTATNDQIAIASESMADIGISAYAQH